MTTSPNTSKSDVHKPQRRYVTFPIEIWELMESGDINWMEMRLYDLVNSLVKSKGEGCWASNAFLSKRLGVNIRRIQVYVQRGIKKGLLRQVGWKKVENKKFRILETAWSRIQFTHVVDDMPRHVGDCAQSKTLTESSKNETPLGGNRRSGNSEESMPFYEEFVPEDKNDPLDLEMARSHRQALIDAGAKPTGKVSRWATEFRRNRKALGAEELKAFTDYYWNWLRKHKRVPSKEYKDGVPGFLDPKYFRSDKTSQWFRDLVGKEKNDPLRTVVSPEMKQLAAPLQAHLPWPKGTKDQVPACCQITLDTYKRFRTAVKEFCVVNPERVLVKTAPKVQKSKKFTEGDVFRPAPSHVLLAHQILRILPSDNGFVETWVRRISQRIANWGEFSGDAAKLAFRKFDSKEFDKIGRGWASAYGGDPKTWDKLMEQINEG